MTVLRTAYVEVMPKTDKFDPELKKRLRRIDTSKEGERHGRVFGTSFVRSSAGPFRAMGGLLTHSIGGVVGALGVVAGIHVFAGFLADARESEKVSRLTAAAIKATGGAAHVTAEQVSDLAVAISDNTGKDDEAIQAGQNMLLTFKNIRNAAGHNNRIFSQASGVLTDMVAAMNGGEVTQENMRKGAISLGKALNDPIKGVTALTRVGVTFTQKQKDQIRSMVEAGNVAGAQKVILAELRSEFGGAAEASSNASDKMRVAMGNLSEEIGTALIPAVDGFSDAVRLRVLPLIRAQLLPLIRNRLVPSVQGLASTLAGVKTDLGGFSAEARTQFNKAAAAGLTLRAELEKIGEKVKIALGWLTEHREDLARSALSVAGVAAGIKAVAIATAGLSLAATLTNPLGLAAAATAGVIAGLVVLATRSAEFRASAVKAWADFRRGVADAWATLKPALDEIRPELNWLIHNGLPVLAQVAVLGLGLVVGALRGAIGQYLVLKARIEFVTGAISRAWHWLNDQEAKVQARSKAIWGASIAFFGQLPGQVRATLGNLLGSLYNVGRDLMQGFINGIRSKIGDLVASVRDAIGSIPATVRNLLGMHSPSRVFAKLGENTMSGYILGLKAQRSTLHRTMASVLGSMPTSPGIGIAGPSLAFAGAPAALPASRITAPTAPTNVTNHWHFPNYIGDRSELVGFVDNALREHDRAIKRRAGPRNL